MNDPHPMSDADVVIIQRRLTHYRVPFFLNLRTSLKRANVNLRLLQGNGSEAEACKNDAGQIEWAEPLSTTYLAGGRLCWQPFARQVAGSALVIITQENAMLANHLALLRKPAPRLAFWGHGANLQGSGRSFREIYKRWSTRRVDWYFAYTKLSADLVAASGFPRARITQLDNAIDMESLKGDLAAIHDADLARLRIEFGLNEGPVGLFLGSLYPHKRLDFLFAAAARLRAGINGFQLLVVGDGPMRGKVESVAAKHPWIRFAGARKGREKAGALKLASIIMNPGLVGLGILDGFAAGVPMITTDCGLHSPEIAYLASDNGVMTPDDMDSYVAACARVLIDGTEHARLAAGCRTAAERYTLSNMVENFTRGVLQALEYPR